MRVALGVSCLGYELPLGKFILWVVKLSFLALELLWVELCWGVSCVRGFNMVICFQNSCI